MICPNCNIKMVNGCCIKCGLLEGGNYIRHDELPSKYDDIRIYNKDFDKMYRNENWYISFLLCNFYYSYRKHIIIGTIFGIIDLLLMFLIVIIYNKLNITNSYLLIYILIIYRILIRTMYATISNSICLYFDSKNLKKGEYKKIGRSYIYLLINILLYLIPIYIYKII